MNLFNLNITKIPRAAAGTLSIPGTAQTYVGFAIRKNPLHGGELNAYIKKITIGEGLQATAIISRNSEISGGSISWANTPGNNILQVGSVADPSDVVAANGEPIDYISRTISPSNYELSSDIEFILNDDDIIYINVIGQASLPQLNVPWLINWYEY